MAGTYTVQQNLELLGRYRYTEIQFMELMGSWAYSMVDPEIKIGFGRHMFQDSIHADLIGKRIPELKGRSQRFHSIPPSDEFVKLLERTWRESDELLRMVGLYHVLKPELVSIYRRHIDHLELPADEPTGYILRLIADEEQDHIEWGEKVIERLSGSANRSDEIVEWQKSLSKDLQDAGGIWGEGKKPGTYVFQKEHPYSKLPTRDSRWNIVQNPAEFQEKNWSFDTNEGKLHLLHDLLNSE
ncbi:ferritin-like domain-containing protein, partial [bacterium]